MNSFSTIIDNMLEFYGARTSGTEERKLQRLARFVNFNDWHVEGVEEQSQEVVVPTTQKKTRTKYDQPVASRTRSRQPIAARTRSQAH